MEWTKFAYISPGTDVDGYQCMCMYIGINLNPIIRLPLRIVTNILSLLMRSTGKLNPWEWKMNSRNVCLTLRLWHWKCLYKICMQSTLFLRVCMFMSWLQIFHIFVTKMVSSNITVVTLSTFYSQSFKPIPLELSLRWQKKPWTSNAIKDEKWFPPRITKKKI